jgi:hypothetical protein
MRIGAEHDGGFTARVGDQALSERQICDKGCLFLTGQGLYAGLVRIKIVFCAGSCTEPSHKGLWQAQSVLYSGT